MRYAVLFVAATVAMGAPHSKRMPDGKHRTTANLDLKTSGSFCYAHAESNCRKYGRMYTWESARRACETMGKGWRLPTDGEWRELAKQFGGINEDSVDAGKKAYARLMTSRPSGFNAVLSGGRDPDGKYARLDAHGFYWTSSADGTATAVYYNFGHGSLALYRQSEGEKQRAFAVRCVKD